MNQPAGRLAAALVAGCLGLALVAGYWSMVRGSELTGRADNPRRILQERRFPRGPILDRNGQALAVSQGAPGAYVRVYPYPALGPLLGYVSPQYGLAGVEMAADIRLHGERAAEEPLSEFWSGLLGRPPHGEAVRLTLDLQLQEMADNALAGQTGAAILLEPNSGFILAMSSSPTFDPNRLEDDWSTLVGDSRAPLLNRAISALYQPGGTLAPAILAAALQDQVTSDTELFPGDGSLRLAGGSVLPCQADLAGPLTAQEALRAGCPGPFAALGARLGPARLQGLFNDLRLFQAPAVDLAGAAAAPDFADVAALSAGQGSLTLTPLHLALVTAAIARRGVLPAPRIFDAWQAEDGHWIPWTPEDHAVAVFSPETAEKVQAWLQGGRTATALAGDRRLAWFTGIAPEGQPQYVAVIILEGGTAEAAAKAGRELLTGAVNP